MRATHIPIWVGPFKRLYTDVHRTRMWRIEIYDCEKSYYNRLYFCINRILGYKMAA